MNKYRQIQWGETPCLTKPLATTKTLLFFTHPSPFMISINLLRLDTRHVQPFAYWNTVSSLRNHQTPIATTHTTYTVERIISAIRYVHTAIYMYLP